MSLRLPESIRNHKGKNSIPVVWHNPKTRLTKAYQQWWRWKELSEIIFCTVQCFNLYSFWESLRFPESIRIYKGKKAFLSFYDTSPEPGWYSNITEWSRWKLYTFWEFLRFPESIRNEKKTAFCYLRHSPWTGVGFGIPTMVTFFKIVFSYLNSMNSSIQKHVFDGSLVSRTIEVLGWSEFSWTRASSDIKIRTAETQRLRTISRIKTCTGHELNWRDILATPSRGKLFWKLSGLLLIH